MTLLTLGLALWVLAHLFKRLAPGMRASLGDKGKGLVAVLVLISVVLMVLGYRAASTGNLYDPIPGMGHLNNLLMLISVFLFGVGGTKGTLYTKLRHPMLLGMLVWAVAHLLVNGDYASVLLFGTLGIWSVVSMVAINVRGPWDRPTTGNGVKGDIRNAVASLVLFAVIAGVHLWLGHSPFMGTYG